MSFNSLIRRYSNRNCVQIVDSTTVTCHSRRYQYVKYTVLVLLVSSLIACFDKGASGAVGNENSQNTSLTEIEQSNGHIIYYGFALVNTYVDDPHDGQDKTDYTDEVQSFTNLGDLLCVEPNQDIRAQLKRYKEAGMAVYLHVFPLLFKPVDGDAPSGHAYSLYPDYQERFEAFYQLNQLNQFRDDIAFLYIGEEPLWNGVDNATIAKVCQSIKAFDANLKTAVIEAYPVAENLQFDINIDYVGFSKYFTNNPASDLNYMSIFNDYIQRLEAHQKMIVVFDSHYIKSAHALSGLSIDDMGRVASEYYQLANQNDSVIALIGYCWPSGFDSADSIGARGMPSHILETYRLMGKQIMTN